MRRINLISCLIFPLALMPGAAFADFSQQQPQPQPRLNYQSAAQPAPQYDYHAGHGCQSCAYTAPAGIEAIRQSDSAAWVSFGGEFFNYKESLPPPTDGERGWMPSVAAGASYMTPGEHWYFAGEGSLAWGDAPYKGALQNLTTGTTTPYNDWTHETIAEFDGKAGKGFALNDEIMLVPYGELGLRYWDRNIRGPFGYTEDYTQFDSLAGLMLQVAPIDRVVLSGYGSYGVTFASKMNTLGATFNMGSAGIAKVGGKASYALTRSVDIFTTVDFEHFRNVNSGQVPVAQIGRYAMEPSSFTNETVARMGVAYKFY